MASRKRKLVLAEDWRKRIQAGIILDRLTKHIKGEIELSATQVSAANILLRKSIPDLTSSDVNAKLTGNLNINWPLPKTPLDK